MNILRYIQNTRVVFLLAISVSTVPISGYADDCGRFRSQVEAEIEKARYCNVDSDCVQTNFGCPFGCDDYVNRKEVARLSKETQDYSAKCGHCIYECVGARGAVKCIEGKCQVAVQ